MKHNIEYRYGNVKLRPIERNDLELLRGWRNNKENTRYLRQIGQISSDMQLGWYEKYLSTNDELGFCIEECDELNRMVGSVFLYDIHDNQAEFGRFLIGDNAAHGRKIGFNACYGVLQIGFKILQLKNIIESRRFLKIIRLTVENLINISSVRDLDIKFINRRF